MRVMSGPHLALEISKAGGLGFIGPGAKPESTAADLSTIHDLIRDSPTSLPTTSSSNSNIKAALNSAKLPIGVGFQLWNGSLPHAVSAASQHHPVAAWLFAPRAGQSEINEWTTALRTASPGISIWLQIGTLKESLVAARSEHKPDVLVIQGAEAGGHGRASDGMGLITLFPEIADNLQDSGILLIAAGGIVDARGIAAALALGADGVAMGTRFLAASEARIAKGYQDAVVSAFDAANSTTRTHLYNHLRGTFGWPELWAPRTIVNKSWVEQQEGVSFEDLQVRHDEAMKHGDKGWGIEGRLATYAGAGVGMVKSVENAASLVERLRGETQGILERVGSTDKEHQ